MIQPVEIQEMTLEDIVHLTEQDMKKVNSTILAQMNSDVVLINTLGHYIVSNGGKGIRPMITILAAHALNYQGDEHITIAAFIEFIHTSTLLHDDVVDSSDLRRGKATANVAFGNAASVLVGDFMYTRSFQLMTSLGSLRILELMSNATNVIAEGEVMQLTNCNNPEVNEEHYLEVIYSKTAKLFEAASQTVAILAGATIEQEKALQDYGRYIGTSFQLIDDLLDYSATKQELGKNLGDDLNEGKPTLPLIHAMHHSGKEASLLIRNAIKEGDGRQLLDQILLIMAECGSLEYTQKKAEEQANKAIMALNCLPTSPYKTALEHLARLSAKRQN